MQDAVVAARFLVKLLHLKPWSNASEHAAEIQQLISETEHMAGQEQLPNSIKLLSWLKQLP